MGSPLQSSKKSNYKDKVIRKLESELIQYKENSPSWIFMNRILGNVMDLLGWILLIGALYIGWKSGKWDTTKLTCDMINPDFCNSCFVYGKQLGGDIIGKGINITFGGNG